LSWAHFGAASGWARAKPRGLDLGTHGDVAVPLVAGLSFFEKSRRSTLAHRDALAEPPKRWRIFNERAAQLLFSKKMDPGFGFYCSEMDPI
jgi:hypothetical protein